MAPERTPDGRWIVVDGRRWRATDPAVPDDVRAQLQSHLGTARSAVRTAKRAGDDEALAAARERVGTAKHGLGERGTPWWDQDEATRRRRWTEALTALDVDASTRRPGTAASPAAPPGPPGERHGPAGA